MRTHTKTKISDRSYDWAKMKENISFATNNEQADHLPWLVINKSNKQM